MATERPLIVDAIIPALDEEATVGDVVRAILPSLRSVVVVDNGSRDATAEVARAAGAEVVREGRRGYGSACLAGIAHLAARAAPPDVVVFIDGDQSDDPGDLGRLLEPIARGAADLVLGSRTRGGADPGSLTPQQRAGNAVAVLAIRALYGHRYSDLGPMRAVRFSSLMALDMGDLDYGWTVEMQVKALKRGLAVVEVPVSYRVRAGGRSKVSGTLRGTLGAGWKILSTIARHA